MAHYSLDQDTIVSLIAIAIHGCSISVKNIFSEVPLLLHRPYERALCMPSAMRFTMTYHQSSTSWTPDQRGACSDPPLPSLFSRFDCREKRVRKRGSVRLLFRWITNQVRKWKIFKRIHQQLHKLRGPREK